MTIPELPPQRFRFFLQTTRGFNPPEGVAGIRENLVDANVLIGAQLLWGIMGREVSYGCILDWMSLTVPGASPHRFIGSSFGKDSEYSRNLSGIFSKLTGLAFMYERAGATWFRTMESTWDDVLVVEGGSIVVTKARPGEDGPDYLVSPFDPRKASLGGAFYALEFKGKKARVEFDSKDFRKWSQQATNVSITQRETNVPINLKAWVLAFNYGFANARTSRQESTILVEDPDIAPGEPLLQPTALNASSIIRDHLARQCVLLGAPVLAAYVRLGMRPFKGTPVPLVYKVGHDSLTDRRYIGQWHIVRGDGSFVRSPWPLDILSKFYLKMKGKNSRWFLLAEDDDSFEVMFQGGGRAAEFLHYAIESCNLVFVGQDANMIRRCLKTQLTQELEGDEFDQELHIVGPVGEAEQPGRISLLRNGSIIASNVKVEMDRDYPWPFA